MTKLKAMRKLGANIVIRQGLNCIKSKDYGQLRIQLNKIKRWRTKLNFD
jgi:hypothetical protein